MARVQETGHLILCFLSRHASGSVENDEVLVMTLGLDAVRNDRRHSEHKKSSLIL